MTGQSDVVRCERPFDHRPHTYLAPLADVDLRCPGGEPDPMDAVVVADQAVMTARTQLDAAVLTAREHGASYAAIGAVLGVTRQAAWERFSKLEERAS